jgi:hypothetical protein
MMKNNLIPGILCILLITLFGFKGDNKDTWTSKQLISPSELADMLKLPQSQQPIILNIGPAGHIKNSISLGVAHEDITPLRKKLEELPRKSDIVIYCGCCPFDHCPNIRPAMKLVNEMKFRNAHLLNLKKNLKSDWIDKGYPMED